MSRTMKSKLPSYLDEFNWGNCYPGDPFEVTRWHWDLATKLSFLSLKTNGSKAFDSVSRKGLWKLLLKSGCPPRDFMMVWWHVYLTWDYIGSLSSDKRNQAGLCHWLYCSFVSSSLQCSKMPSGTATMVIWSDSEATGVSSISSVEKLGLRCL